MRDATRTADEKRQSWMRVYAQREIEARGQLPSPIEVVERVGGNLSLAMRVLTEFPQFDWTRYRHPRGASRLRGRKAS